MKLLHVDGDWIMRHSGDVTCRPVQVWRSGLLDALPGCIDHAVVGAADGMGRNGWGGALLMRDVTPDLVPPGDEPVGLEQHRGFLDHMATVSARFWGWTDDVGLHPPTNRRAWFGPGMQAVEEARGWPDDVPRIVRMGWGRFFDEAPSAVASVIADLQRDGDPLSVALATTPSTFLHGDWKMGNLGTAAEGRTVLLDWAVPGQGPACQDLCWYLALNRSRIPEGKEESIAAYRAALERHGIATDAWWDRQLSLCLLDELVLFGWEKVLGDPSELAWRCDRAQEGAALL